MREKKDQVDVLELVDGGHHQGSHEVGLQIMMHWYRSEMQNMAQDAQRKCNCYLSGCALAQLEHPV